jgi:hypothetical protein
MLWSLIHPLALVQQLQLLVDLQKETHAESVNSVLHISDPGSLERGLPMLFP